ncbi:MAG: hypothetical protein U1E65_10695 [Myxococcota bacterium]
MRRGALGIAVLLGACAGSVKPKATAPPDPANIPRLFSAESPWNQPIPEGAALDPDSPALVQTLVMGAGDPGIWINLPEWSVPRFFADANTPRYDVEVSRVRGEGFEEGSMIPVPDEAAPDPESDSHMLVVDLIGHREYDFFKAAPTGTGWSCAVCASIAIDGTGVRPPEDSANPWTLAHGARACGFPLGAGLITPEEIAAGEIPHALEMSVRFVRANEYVSPASTGHAETNEVLPDRGLRCGTRVRLDPTLDVTTLGLNSAGTVIARALQKYGAFIGDYAGGVVLVADNAPQAVEKWRGVLSSADVAKLPLGHFFVLAPPGPVHKKKL